MSTIDINCPSCGTAIELTKTLAAPLLESQKQEFNKSVALQEKAQRDREDAIKKREEQLSQSEKEIALRVQTELEKVKAEQTQENEKKYSQKISILEKQVDSQHKEYLAMQKSELELRQSRDIALREKAAAELEIQRQVDQRITAEREDATTKATEKAAKELAKQEQILVTLRAQISDMERKADPTAAHIHGDIQEQNVFGKLQMEFPQDSFDRVTKGVRGADIIQRVMQPNGRIAGTILVEIKNTQNWDNNWLVKLKDDQRSVAADIPVIVSRALPKDITSFANIEHVWVCSESVLLPMIACLRSGILGVAKEKAATMVSSDRKEQIFQYLKSTSFSMRIAAIMESHQAMHEELRREKQAQMNYWAKRERSLHRMLEGISGLSGDFQHLGGPGVLENAEHNSLELDTSITNRFLETDTVETTEGGFESETKSPTIINNNHSTQTPFAAYEIEPSETKPAELSISGFSAIPSGANASTKSEPTMKILKLLVKKGQSVKTGTHLVSVLDGNQSARFIEAQTKGRVRSINLVEGDDLTESEIYKAINITGFYS